MRSFHFHWWIHKRLYSHVNTESDEMAMLAALIFVSNRLLLLFYILHSFSLIPHLIVRYVSNDAYNSSSNSTAPKSRKY